MKKLIFNLLLCLPIIVNGQVATRLNVTQAVPLDSSSMNVLGVDTVAGAMNRIWTFKWSSMKVKPYQMKWWGDSMTIMRTSLNNKLNKVDTTNKWRSYNWTPTYNDIRLKPNLALVATSANYNDLINLPAIPSDQITSDWNAVSGKGQILNKPNLNNYYLNSNPNGYINSVIGSLGYNPANSSTTISINGQIQSLASNRVYNVGTLTGADTTSLSNRINKRLVSSDTLNKWKSKSYIPALSELDIIYGYRAYDGIGNSQGFLKTFTELDPLFNTKFNAKSTTDLVEGTNKYYSDLRARASITLTTSGSGAATYNQTTGGLNIPTPVSIIVPTFNNNVVRTLNTNYTISTTQPARVSYTVRVSYSITVILGSTGSISLQYSTNSGTSWITVSTISNNLNLGIALTGYNDFNLSGEIPTNALVKILSTVTNATNSYQTGQEILY